MTDRQANYHSDCQHYEERKRQYGDGRDSVCVRLGLRVNRLFNMSRMIAAVVAGARGIVNARSRNSDRTRYTMTPKG